MSEIDSLTEIESDSDKDIDTVQLLELVPVGDSDTLRVTALLSVADTELDGGIVKDADNVTETEAKADFENDRLGV